MKTSLLALGLVLLFGRGPACAAEPSDYKDIVVVDARPKTPVVTHLAIRLVVFDPPGHFRDGLPASGTRPMPWQMAYLADQYYERYSTEEIVHYSSKEFIEKHGIETAAFERKKKSHKPNPQYSELTSLWAVYCRLKGHEFAFWVVYDSGWLDKTPKSAFGLKYGVGIRTYENIGGIWKNQLDSVTGICTHLPLANCGQLAELLRCKRGILQPGFYSIVPVEAKSDLSAEGSPPQFSNPPARNHPEVDNSAVRRAG